MERSLAFIMRHVLRYLVVSLSVGVAVTVFLICHFFTGTIEFHFKPKKPDPVPAESMLSKCKCIQFEDPAIAKHCHEQRKGNTPSLCFQVFW